ncbi:LysR family transcriptional regulator [Alteromonas sp. 345S023]|uniref:HTH-type transcriptional regulator MetR n=1 Tax=Alteromonas profundi TaxID=2696062 RepID=A0A7X5LLY8_9ALTE|nr:LysR family transcriptional regulator [Alteromonas profundi]NDV91820.1 LysR family transcriptional regulator [Alteromonas profundi]
MIERQHLRIVSAIAQHGTMTEAAKALFLTQSALSHAMKKVENSFNVPIWRKEGRTLVLTQAGKSILSLANRVLPQFEHAEAQLRKIAEGKQGTLRIGMECHPCFEWLLKVVAPFLKAFPDVDVDVRRAFSFGGLQALHGYDIDLLLTPDPLHLATINYTAVFDYEQVLVMHRGHSLLTQPYVRPDQLAEETLISYPVEQSRLDIFSHFLTPAGCTVKDHRKIETTEIILQMVASGRGITALPKWLIDESREVQQLGYRPLGEHGLKKTLYLGHRKDSDPLGFVDAFIELALSHNNVNND